MRPRQLPRTETVRRPMPMKRAELVAEIWAARVFLEAVYKFTAVLSDMRPCDEASYRVKDIHRFPEAKCEHGHDMSPAAMVVRHPVDY